MRFFYVDLEADGFLEEATKVHCCVAISHDGKERHKFSPLSGPSYIEQMLAFLESCDTLVFHNGYGYDFPLLEKLYDWTFKGNRIDTLVISRLLNPKRRAPFGAPSDVQSRPHSIEAWGYRVGRGKPDHSDWSVFSLDMLHRCEEDVEILKLVHESLEREKGTHNWGQAVSLTTSLFTYLAKQEQYGWKVDQVWMNKSIRMLDHWIDKVDRLLFATLPFVMEVEEKQPKGGEMSYVKMPFVQSGAYHANTKKWMERVGYDPDSKVVGGPYSRVEFRRLSLNKPEETKNFLLDSGWEPLDWNTNDEGVRTSPKMNKDDPFEGVSGFVGKLIVRRVQCRHRRSQIEGWFKAIRSDGRIASVVANLAETGRATHKRIVNVPNGDAFFGKWMRKCFVADEGKVLVGVDSAGCQIRMLAARMGDKGYMDTVLNGDKNLGTDIHSVNMRAAGLDSRGNAKTFFYGFLFGAGDLKVGKIVKGTAVQGRQLKEQFLKGLPALGELMKALVTEWRRNAKRRSGRWGKLEYYDGWITGLDGRPIFVSSEHAILVYVLQSDEAIMMAAAYCWAFRRISAKYVWGKQWGIVCWMHDEINIECDPEIAEDVRDIVEKCISDAGNFYKIACPHEGDGAIGRNWYEVH